jgi:hypothetical protein
MFICKKNSQMILLFFLEYAIYNIICEDLLFIRGENE